MNLLSIAKNFATEDQALDHLVKYRWPDGVRCLACDHPKVYRIDTKGKLSIVSQDIVQVGTTTTTHLVFRCAQSSC